MNVTATSNVTQKVNTERLYSTKTLGLQVIVPLPASSSYSRKVNRPRQVTSSRWVNK